MLVHPQIKSWMRPFPYLSNGEQSRVILAMTLKNDAHIDDFGTIVDPVQAASMASAIQKMVRAHGFRRVLIATTHPIVVHFLQPDFVVLSSGEVVQNPAFSPDGEQSGRKRVDFHWDKKGLGTFAEAGYPMVPKEEMVWTGEEDDCADILQVRMFLIFDTHTRPPRAAHISLLAQEVEFVYIVLVVFVYIPPAWA